MKSTKASDPKVADKLTFSRIKCCKWYLCDTEEQK